MERVAGALASLASSSSLIVDGETCAVRWKEGEGEGEGAREGEGEETWWATATVRLPALSRIEVRLRASTGG